VFDLSFHGGVSTVKAKKNCLPTLKSLTVQVSTVFVECFSGEKKLLRWWKRGVSTVVLQKVFQLSFNGGKKSVPTVKKEFFCTVVLQWQKRCLNGVWTVTKKVMFTVKKSVSTVILQWQKRSFNGVWTVRKIVVSTVNKKTGFHSYFTVKKRSFDNLSIVVFPP